MILIILASITVFAVGIVLLARRWKDCYLARESESNRRLYR